MQLDIDQAIRMLKDMQGDSCEYEIEREIDGQKYKIRISIEPQ